MRPVSIRIAPGPEPRESNIYQAFIVEETGDLFAIDERYPAEPAFREPALWAITHIPTGRRLRYGAYFGNPESKERAAELAQNFYKAAIARGWNVASSDPDEFANNYRGMSGGALQGFWREVIRSRL